MFVFNRSIFVVVDKKKSYLVWQILRIRSWTITGQSILFQNPGLLSVTYTGRGGPGQFFSFSNIELRVLHVNSGLRLISARLLLAVQIHGDSCLGQLHLDILTN